MTSHHLRNGLLLIGVYIAIYYLTTFNAYQSAMLAFGMVIFAIVVDIERAITEQ